MPNPLDLSANYQDSDGNWYTDDGYYLGSGSNATNGTQEVVEDKVLKPFVQDSSYGTVERWAQQNGYKISNETLDYLYNQFFTEKNNESAWQRTLEADNTKYQRMVEDIKKAGLNPFVTGFGSASSTGQSSAGSVGSGSIASIKNQAKQSGSNILGNVIGAIASIAGAAIMAMVLA